MAASMATAGAKMAFDAAAVAGEDVGPSAAATVAHKKTPADAGPATEVDVDDSSMSVDGKIVGEKRRMRPFLTIPPKKAFGPYEEIARLPGVVIICRSLPPKSLCYICRHCIVMRYSLESVNYHRKIWHGLAPIPPEDEWENVQSVPEYVPRNVPVNDEDISICSIGLDDSDVHTPPVLANRGFLSPDSGKQSSVDSPPNTSHFWQLTTTKVRWKTFSNALGRLGSPMSKTGATIRKQSSSSGGVASIGRSTNDSILPRIHFASRLRSLEEGCELSTDVIELFAVTFSHFVVEDMSFRVEIPWFWEKFVQQRQSSESLRRWCLRSSVALENIRTLVVPIHGSGHWSFLVLCLKWTAGDKLTVAALHLDSVEGLHEENFGIKRGADIICSRLAEATGRPKDRYSLKWISVDVPQQDNNIDCGAFTLFFIRECYCKREMVHRVSWSTGTFKLPAEVDVARISRTYARTILMMHWQYNVNEVASPM